MKLSPSITSPSETDLLSMGYSDCFCLPGNYTLKHSSHMQLSAALCLWVIISSYNEVCNAQRYGVYSLKANEYLNSMLRLRFLLHYEVLFNLPWNSCKCSLYTNAVLFAAEPV